VTDAGITSVSHVLWSGNIGGIERLVRDLAAEQSRLGMRVTVAFGHAEGPFVEEVREGGARVADLGFNSGYDLRPSRIGRGAAVLREADVIHLHAFNLSLAAVCRRAKRPVVFTEHGNFGLGRRLGLSGHVKRRLQRAFLRRDVEVMAANSKHTAAYMGAIYGIDRSAVAVVHNGIDAAREGSHSTLDPDELRIAFVGRLVSLKRVDRIIVALSRAARRDRMRLVVVGGGPLEQELRRLAVSHGVDSRAEFLGQRLDVSEILASVDVLVQSTLAEAFGLAILEACAEGALPLVFADGGGALEALPPDGLVVADEDDLAATLDGLLDSPTLSSDARRHRAAWVRKHFSISTTARKYRELYQLAARRAR
jgi:glycosyltransferase involved in cell wall biosynthesis